MHLSTLLLQLSTPLSSFHTLYMLDTIDTTDMVYYTHRLKIFNTSVLTKVDDCGDGIGREYAHAFVRRRAHGGQLCLQCTVLKCKHRRKSDGLCVHAAAVWRAFHTADQPALAVADVLRLPHQHHADWNSRQGARTAALSYWGEPTPGLLEFVQPNVPLPYTRLPPPRED